MFSESHCHLRRLNDNELEQTIENAEKASIELILTAGTSLTTSKKEIQNARKYPILKACIGIHPWNADLYSEKALSTLKELAVDEDVVAVSEIGLDYKGRRTPEGERVSKYIDKRIQLTAFRGQLRLAKDLDLPVFVHDRTANQELLDILEEEENAEIGAVIHGFTKDSIYAKRCVDMGIYLSIGLRGISAAENEALIIAIKQTPIEFLLTETDSSSPSGVITVIEKIAELKGLTRGNVSKTTTQNLRKLTQL